MKKLSEIKIGKKVVIKQLLSSDKYKRRLMELGLIKGTEIEIIKIAPLKNLLVIQVRGYELTLRKEELDLIIVEDK